MTSRNKREGKYAGKFKGIHLRDPEWLFDDVPCADAARFMAVRWVAHTDKFRNLYDELMEGLDAMERSRK